MYISFKSNNDAPKRNSEMEPTNKKHKTCSPPDAKSDISDDESQIGAPNDVVIIGSSNKSDTSPTEESQKIAKLQCSSQLAKNLPHLIPIPSCSAIPGQSYPMHGVNVNGSPQGQPVPPFPQSTVPFWIPQRPGQCFPGPYPFPFYQLVQPGRTNEASRPGACQGNSGSQNPGFYPFGFPYPGFPGPWDPSSWMSQPSQSRPSPFSGGFQGLLNQFTYSQTSMPCSQVPSDPSPQRRVKQPLSELSLEQQKFWESQSSQNVQLWNTVRKLHCKMDEYKCHVKRLETELEALKSVLKEASNNGTAASVAEKKSKIEIPGRMVSSNILLHSSRPPIGNQKSGLFKVKSESRQLQFEKVILKKVDNSHNTVPILQQGDRKVDTQTTNCSEKNESFVFGSPIYGTQNHQGASTVFNSKVSFENTKGDSNICFIPSQQIGGTGMVSSSTNHAAHTCNGTQTTNCSEKNESLVIGSPIYSTQNHQGASTIFNSKVSLENSKGDSNICFIASQQIGVAGMVSSSTNHAAVTCNGTVKIEQQ